MYLLGLLIMLVVAGIMIWPELELLFFDRPLIIEEPLETLSCPLAVTADEDATIAVAFRNERDRDERFRTRARFSYLSARLMDEFEQWVELAPGEETVVRWSLDPESAAFGRMILARVHVSRRGSIPAQQGGCGVMVLNLPFFSGTQIVLGLATAGLLALAASGYVWLAGRRPQALWHDAAIRRRALLAATVAAAMFAGLFGLWLLGSVLLVGAGLLGVSLWESGGGE